MTRCSFYCNRQRFGHGLSDPDPRPHRTLLRCARALPQAQTVRVVRVAQLVRAVQLVQALAALPCAG